MNNFIMKNVKKYYRKNMLLYYAIQVILFTIVKTTIASNIEPSEGYLIREHSLIKPFLTQMSLPHWDWNGSTMVSTNFIRLTADVQGQGGSLWNQVPIMFQNWEIEISFAVYGRSKELCGDGFTIWYARDRLAEGSMFGNKENFNGLAIILDTYNNNNGPNSHHFPYISAMINNGSLRYDHDKDGEDTQLAGCEAKFRNTNFETKINIKYLYDTLSVQLDIENKNSWKTCLTVNDVKLPTGYFIGVSAATGDLSDNHDILSIKTFDLGGNQDGDSRLKIIPSAKYPVKQKDQSDSSKPSMSNLKIFFIILLILIVICVLLVSFKIFLEKYQDKSRKRLY